MNREIRFRAWYKPGLEMYRVLDMHFQSISGDLYGVLNEGSPYSVNARDVEMMQFTGLHDKNGKEIYEGDIVNNVTYKFNGVVFFDNGSFWVREYLSHVDEGLYDDREKETRWSINLNWEVIGNIYENADLLPGGIRP